MSDNQDQTDDQAPEDKQTYNDPELAINRVYTRRGDSGTTDLVGGQTVSKAHPRIEAYGTVDELNTIIGSARQVILDEYAHDPSFRDLSKTLLRVQHELFNLGSVLATLPEDVGEQMPRVTDGDIEALEESIDEYNEDLPDLRSFVLPGGSRLNVELHRGRTVCRRAERTVVELTEQEDAEVDSEAVGYLNRLADALFVWSRWAVVQSGQKSEVVWEPNQSSSGQGR
jgi:cob(I)alamin adenosyltransferase